MWKFVQIKIIKIKDKLHVKNTKLMVLICDVSEHMLYKDIIAQQNLLTLINATVSHELRNPLHSMIGQITGMEKFLKKLNNLANFLGSSKHLSSSEVKILESSVREVFEGLSAFGEKLTSSVKFVDYFVHDILDYTILNKEEKNFTKQISVFDI
jgi:signal transduction histidine kinase